MINTDCSAVNDDPKQEVFDHRRGNGRNKDPEVKSERGLKVLR